MPTKTSKEQAAILVEKSEGVLRITFNRPAALNAFTVPLMELTTYYDPGKNPVRAGDLFVDLGIYAGNSGETDRQFLLDDVVVLRKVY